MSEHMSISLPLLRITVQGGSGIYAIEARTRLGPRSVNVLRTKTSHPFFFGMR